MTSWKHSSILREFFGSLSVTLLIALTVSVSTPRPASAQAAAGDDGTVAAIAADGDTADNIDRPPPSADYDRPADAATTAPDTDAEPADGTDDQVLELPQVIDPATYAAVSYAPASRVPAVAPPSADDADGSADPPAVVMSNPPVDSPDDSADQPAEASAVGDDDAQSYANQGNNDGGGPVVVYAAPIYVPMYPVITQPNPLPRPYTGLPMYSALYNHTMPAYSALSNRMLPIYSGLGPVAPSRYNVPNGSRLWNSPLGQGFGLARGRMMGGFPHAR